jgi:hypothetical protein
LHFPFVRLDLDPSKPLKVTYSFAPLMEQLLQQELPDLKQQESNMLQQFHSAFGGALEDPEQQQSGRRGKWGNRGTMSYASVSCLG